MQGFKRFRSADDAFDFAIGEMREREKRDLHRRQVEALETIANRRSVQPASATRPGRQAAAPKGDGPHDPYEFWWKGKVAKLEPKAFALLSHIWNEKGRTTGVQTVEDKVWGDLAETDSRLKSATSKANRGLGDVGCPLGIHKRGTILTLD
jgi:DNA-binding response OmpR family regulator